MADFHSSSNPFRRKTPALQGATENGVQAREIATTRQLPINIPVEEAESQNKSSGKLVKRVRVQSPPPSSPEDATREKSHAPLAQGREGHALGHDPFETVISDESSDDTDEGVSSMNGASKNGRAPANPFSKTLATLERTEGKKFTTDAPPVGVGKATMDVDAFKRLLMTGNSGVTVPVPLSTPPVQPTHVGPNDGSSTDASSVSRHSIFENIQENLPESPRTSHEVSDAEEERRQMPILKRSASERKRPPPPSSRHGKLINMQLKDETRPQSLYLTSTSAPSPLSSSMLTSSPAQRSVTDLNKPLPPAPSRASHDSDRESVFDRESVGKVPEPPSPTNSIRRKPAPAPPSARRHGHAAADLNTPHQLPKRLSNTGDESSRNSSTQDLPSLHSTANQPIAFKVPPPSTPPPPRLHQELPSHFPNPSNHRHRLIPLCHLPHPLLQAPFCRASPTPAQPSPRLKQNEHRHRC